MNLHLGKSMGITLSVAAAVLVALMAVVFAYAPGVGADECDTAQLPIGTTATPTLVPDVHQDADGDVCGEANDPQHENSTTHAAISSTEPGALVAIRLSDLVLLDIEGDSKITVDFSGPIPDSGFTVPSSFDDDEIAIASNGVSTDLDKGDVEVEGEKVILTAPTAVAGSYTITFKRAAGIRNPYYVGSRASASSREIIVSSDGQAPVGIPAVIHRRTTITPVAGQRGRRITLSGKGYARGTVTIFNGHPDSDASEILDTVNTRAGTLSGSFSKVLSGLFQPGVRYYEVWTKDSEGVVDSATFSITEHTLSFEPARVVAGETLRIVIEDYQDEHEDIVAVRIAGEDAFPNRVIEYSECIEYVGREISTTDRVLTLEVTVPEGILLGDQTVSLYDYSELDITYEDENVAVEMKRPCTDLSRSEEKGERTDKKLKVRLRDNTIPLIQETVEVISQDQALGSAIAQNIVEVDGGRDRELELRVYPAARNESISLGADDRIEITLQGFDLSGAIFDSPDLEDPITISGSGPNSPDTVPSQIDVAILESKLILTVPSAIVRSAGEYLEININSGTGILTPDTPRGFDDPDEGYPIAIAFIDAGNRQPYFTAPDVNVLVVKNPISSSVPSATVRVVLVANAGEVIGRGEEIEVDFSGPSDDSEFVVPSSITKTRITIRSGNQSFSPSEVQVQGARVILTIPSGDDPEDIVPGEFTIIFSNLARIRNPFAAGNRIIRVSSFVEGDEPDEITAVIKRTTAIDPLEGPRGSAFELDGKGYARGTVTIYHDADGNKEIDAGETLDSVNTVRGAFTVDIVARGKPSDPEYRVRTRDSEGVEEEVVFNIRSGMFFEPSTARVGRPLKITVTDWQTSHLDVAAVRIGGEDAFVADVREYANCFAYTGVYEADGDRVLSLEIKEVPRNVPAGEQTVALYDHEQLDHFEVIDGARATVADKGPCADLSAGEGRGSLVRGNVEARLKADPIAIAKATVEVDTQDLVLTPSTAARGQRVTITGSGFSRAGRGSGHIDSVWIGGKRVVDDHSGFEVGSNGNIAFAVTVPLGVADGDNEVRIEGTDHTLGQATLTIPEAAITVAPAQGQRGTELTIMGSGFVAGEAVIVSYGPAEGETLEAAPLSGSGLLADTGGEFELAFKVPVTAEVGKTYRITAYSRLDARGEAVLVEAESSHFVPKAVITKTPDEVSPGDHLTVRGQYLPPFTLVGPIKIAGIALAPAAEVATDEEGSFETNVLVPHIEYGDHTLLVQVAGVIAPIIVNVAAPPRTGPPDQVFKQLIKVGALLAIWRYDNEEQSWGLFDTAIAEDMPELNDLSEVGSGDIMWVNLTQPQYFQGVGLTEGWSLIELQ